MSRAKSRQNVEICGDCGAPDATWASVNKGILLCTQCCSIHRSLGRHISQVKSLQKSSWHPNQLAMVCTLNNNGANNIWEHLLLENNSKFMKKKPNPKDPLSVKSEFIKVKHLQCVYTFRDNTSYDEGLENELGKQLHASVRTPNLETSFRLLVQGADPNYFHNERGTTPLHVAAKSDQRLQVELLLIYGADPTFPDAHGKTPIDYAKKNVNKDLINRLIESQYEVTDAFIQYLTHKKPDHQNGIHFILPPGGFESNPNSLNKLQKMKNVLFEQLAMDVYDEIDRRETEAIWLSCVDAIDLNVVPFLPVDQTMSKPRNQGRQKLARFSTPELKSLVFDILLDIQRRQMLAEAGPNKMNIREYSPVSDDDPLYDAVAPDEDYATLPPIQEVNASNKEKQSPTVEELTKQLQESDCTILDLKAEVNQLKTTLELLKSENNELRSRLSQVKVCDNSINGDEFNSSQVISNGDIEMRQNRKNQRPSSMYETREGLKTPNWQLLKNQIKQNDQPRNATQSLYGAAQDKQSVFECTELITRCIQALCKSIQDREDCVASGEKLKFAVARLATILPKDVEGKSIKMMREILPFLLNECSSLQNAYKQNDSAIIDYHVNKIREWAFHLAKHTKEIVTRYSSTQ